MIQPRTFKTTTTTFHSLSHYTDASMLTCKVPTSLLLDYTNNLLQTQDSYADTAVKVKARHARTRTNDYSVHIFSCSSIHFELTTCYTHLSAVCHKQCLKICLSHQLVSTTPEPLHLVTELFHNLRSWCYTNLSSVSSPSYPFLTMTTPTQVMDQFYVSPIADFFQICT